MKTKMIRYWMALGFSWCVYPLFAQVLYESETLIVSQLTDHSFIHTSFLQTEDFGKVACNGMFVIGDGEAIVFDTPVLDSVSDELIGWIRNELNSEPKAVIVTHFHHDCLGGIEAFHRKEIPSYASKKTIELAKETNKPLPLNGFDGYLKLDLGDQQVMSDFVGEGHTSDNVVGYFPFEKVLFGGCLIKETGAGIGYVGDANVNEWPLTVRRLKEKYSDAEFIVPGHGKIGGQELLDYTIELFER